MKNLLVFTLLFLFGCSTPQKEFTIKYQPQKFKIDLLKTTQVMTKKGLKINFNQEVIDRIYGLTSTYNIEVQVHEFYRLEDFILNNLETITTDGEILESAGMFKIDLLYGDDFKIDLENAEGMSLSIPYTFDREAYDFKTFDGNIANGMIRWENPKDISPEQFLAEDDTIGFDIYHSEISSFFNFEMETLNWINVDRFLKLGDENLATVSITMENDYEILSSGIFIEGTQSYLGLSAENINNKTLASSIKLPIDESIVVVAFVTDGKDYFVADEEAVVGKTDQVKLSFEKIPKEEILAKFKGQ